MLPNEIKESLRNAAYDLKFLLNRGYRKKAALNLVTNKYLLDKNGRNYLVRKVFSDEKSRERTAKIVDINNINNETIFIDGYNVLISVETICKQEYGSLLMCDDGILRDVKAVFGKYRITSSTDTALNYIIIFLSKFKPDCVYFLYDSPVSKSGALANYTDNLIKTNGLNGAAVTHNSVDFELVKLSRDFGGIVATSDSVVIDKVEQVLDIPYWIFKTLKCD